MPGLAPNEVLKSHWNIYREKLVESGFESPYDWYTQDQFIGNSDHPIDDPEIPVWNTLKELPLHVLYRVMGYEGQDLALVMHNPSVKLSEIESPDEIEPHEDEIGKLREFDDVDPTGFGGVCGPNWRKYIREGRTGVVNVDGEWNHNSGQLFRNLETYSSKVEIHESQRQSYFEPDDQSSDFLNDFYYTNVFKLPTPTGDGSEPFRDSDVDEEFYEDLARQELDAVDPDVAFIFGRAAYDALVDGGTWVDTGYGSPSSGFREKHGYLYKYNTDTYYVPLVHIGYSDYPNQEVLETTIKYLVEQDML